MRDDVPNVGLTPVDQTALINATQDVAKAINSLQQTVFGHSAQLTAIAALTSGTGHLSRIGNPATWILRTFADGPRTQWSNPAGVAGNPSVDLIASTITAGFLSSLAVSPRLFGSDGAPGTGTEVGFNSTLTYTLGSPSTIGVATTFATSGTWTPTVTPNGNVTAGATASLGQYIRIGSAVTASVRVNLTPTAAGAAALGVSLPIASNFANAYECSGSGNAPAIAGMSMAVAGDAGNNRADVQWIAVDFGTARDVYLHFTYLVI